MSHIHTLKLHQLRLGELDAAEEGQLRKHLAGCALCASRLGHQVQARQQFQRMPMPEALEPRPSWWERLRAWLPAAALVPAALAGAFVLRAPDPVGGPVPDDTPPAAAPLADAAPAAPLTVAPSASATSATVLRAAPRAVAEVPAATPAPSAPATSPPPPEAPAAELTRTKGVTPRLEAWVQAGESARPLYLGETLGAGDRLQLRYDPRGRAFVTLAGRDSNGLVEVYGTMQAGGDGLTAAPFSLTLDGSAGEQAFFALCTDARPDPEAVRAAIAHNPVRMEGAVVASVVVRKD